MEGGQSGHLRGCENRLGKKDNVPTYDKATENALAVLENVWFYT